MLISLGIGLVAGRVVPDWFRRGGWYIIFSFFLGEAPRW